MSTIPTRQIDGDVAVSRNVVTGGDATVRGSVNVGHDLRVEGWLDAPRMKVVCKGIFSSKEKLEHAYPSPLPGWYAGVCVGEKTELWLAVRELDEYRGAVWKRSSGAFVAVVDDTRYKEMVSEIASLRKQVENGLGGMDELKNGVSAAKGAAESAQRTADAAKQSADTAAGAAAAAMPRTLDIGLLDTMGAADARAMMELVKSGALHTRYAVVNETNFGPFIVGTLDVFSDNMRHMLTQVLETHHTLNDDGSLDVTGHRDERLYRYFRSFNFSAATLDVEKNTWTAWKECVPHTLTDWFNEAYGMAVEPVFNVSIKPEYDRVLVPIYKAPILHLEEGGETLNEVIPAATVDNAGVMTANDKSRLDHLFDSVGSCNLPIDTITEPGYYRLTNGVVLAVSKSANEALNPTTAKWTVTQTMFAFDGIQSRSVEVVKSGKDVTKSDWTEWKSMRLDIPLATESESGLMSSADKVRLDVTFGSVMKCMSLIDTITEPGFYRTQYNEVLVVSKSGAQGNPAETWWTVTQTLFAHDGIKRRSVVVTRIDIGYSMGTWSAWVNIDERVTRKIEQLREDVDSLKEIVGTLSGGSGPVKVIRFDEDTGTLYI